MLGARLRRLARGVEEQLERAHLRHERPDLRVARLEARQLFELVGPEHLPEGLAVAQHTPALRALPEHGRAAVALAAHQAAQLPARCTQLLAGHRQGALQRLGQLAERKRQPVPQQEDLPALLGQQRKVLLERARAALVDPGRRMPPSGAPSKRPLCGRERGLGVELRALALLQRTVEARPRARERSMVAAAHGARRNEPPTARSRGRPSARGAAFHGSGRASAAARSRACRAASPASSVPAISERATRSARAPCARPAARWRRCRRARPVRSAPDRDRCGPRAPEARGSSAREPGAGRAARRLGRPAAPVQSRCAHSPLRL